MEISQFLDFSRWWPSAILFLFGAYLDYARIVCDLYRFAEFGCERCSGFNNL